ncbi:MAG: succinylglutamate desuccinylase/aspartoacylase family protein [Candidatus Aminicenantes bacterium]|nr:succinylglutamate desuccinylase/aspartoacylase family protein [Candidatus Aminicenantes bacterium]
MAKNRRMRAAGSFMGVFVAIALAQVQIPKIAPATHDVRPGPGVKVKRLSDYFSGIARTPGDTAVYIMEGAEPGGTVLVAGGTHANEIGGSMAAIVLVEKARVERGRLIVIPYANNSAITYQDPARPGGPRSFEVKTAGGERIFSIGARLTRPEHQGEADPPGTKAASHDSAMEISPRDLDRQYPGKADGNLTQRIAYAVVALLKKENVDLAFDLHEAPPGSRLAMMIVANPKNAELGAEAVLVLEAEGLAMKLEESSATFRGLSHREWGDATRAKAFLFETPNPASRRESPGDPVSDGVWPLAKRVGIHLKAIGAILGAYNEAAEDKGRIRIGNLPELEEITKAGLGAYLR